MPLVVKDELVRIPFTPYAHSEYIRVRGAELDIQEKKHWRNQPILRASLRQQGLLKS
jgi:hypothetical protein